METLVKENKTKNNFSVETTKELMELNEMTIPNEPKSLKRVDIFMHSLSMLIYAVIFYVLLSNV